MTTNNPSVETTTVFEEGTFREPGLNGTIQQVDHLQFVSLAEKRGPQTEDNVETSSKAMSDQENQEYVTGVKLILILVPITLAYFLIMLDGSIVSTAIPEITSDFNSLLDVGWYGSAYQLASSAFQPLSGQIYTHFSIKWSFLTFFFVFELGSALCGAAQSSTMLIVGRAVAGLGSSGLMNGALTMIAAILPPHKQPMVMGINVGLGQLGIACGPLIGGAFTEYASWRWCFYINLPIGAIVGVLLGLLRIPENKSKPPARKILDAVIKSFDLPGFALVAPAAIMFFLALQYGGNQYSWSSSTVIGLFVGAAMMFVLFLAWEYRQGDEAMMPFSLLKERIVWSASGTMFFFLGVMFVGNYYLPIYLQAVKADSPLMSGVHILPTILSQVLFAMISGVMVESLGYYLPWVLGGTALSAVAYGLLSLLNPSTPVSKWAGYQVLFGVSCGAAATGSFIAVQNLVPAAQIPIAMAILIFYQNLGAGVFLMASQTIFSNSLRKLIAQRAPEVNSDLILATGARSIRELVSGAQLAGVLEAYSTSIDRVMYLGVGIGGAAFMCAWGLGLKDIRVQKKLKEIKKSKGDGERED